MKRKYFTPLCTASDRYVLCKMLRKICQATCCCSYAAFVCLSVSLQFAVLGLIAISLFFTLITQLALS